MRFDAGCRDIRAAGRGPETAWHRFAMFSSDRARPAARRRRQLFYVAAAAGKILESAPLERVNFLRDEMANIVWRVEAIVRWQTGAGMSGNEASRHPTTEAPRVIKDDDVRIAYVAGTTVPKNWIPFIPVHAKDSVSEIRFQRARMAGSSEP